MKSILSQQTVKDFRRVLLSRPDRIGDVVITTSCFKAIHDVYPHLEIYFLVKEANAPLLKNHPLLSGLLTVPKNIHSVDDTASHLSEAMRKLQPDCIVHFHYDNAVAGAALAVGIPYILGHSKKIQNPCLTHSVLDRKKEGLNHEANYNFELLSLLQITQPDNLEPWITPEPVSDERLLEILPWWTPETPFVVLHMSAHARKARIPTKIFAELSSWFINELNFRIVLIGSESNDPAIETYIGSIGDHKRKVSNLIGVTHLAETARVLSEARILISRDSGPAHIAAALQCPTVTIVGPLGRHLASTRWRPLGSSALILEKPVRPRFLETTRSYQERYFNAFTAEEIKKGIWARLEGRSE